MPFWKEIADKFTSGALPPRSARRRSSRRCASRPSSRQALAHRGRQARGVREGHGRQGPRARQGRRRRATGRSRRSPRRSRPSCARRDQRRARARRTATSSSSSSARTSVVQTVMANLRVHLAKKLGLIPEVGHGGKCKFLWVVNPPLFEYDDETKTLGRGAPRLHPPARRLRRRCSRRIRARSSATATTSCSTASRSAAARSVSTIPRCRRRSSARSASRTRRRAQKFGFLLDALRYGAPPHGGIAIGMDRLAMLLSGAREPARRHPVPEDAEGAPT